MSAQEFQFDLKKPFSCNAALLQFLCLGHALSSILFSAAELGVFDHLEEEPGSTEEVAARAGVSVNALKRLLVALLAMGLLSRDEEGRYHNSPVAKSLLTSTSSSSLHPLLLYQKRHALPLFSRLSEAIKTGEPQFASAWEFFLGEGEVESCYRELTARPEELGIFLPAMNLTSTGTGRVIAGQYDFKDIRSLIDLGGGGGQVAKELAEQIPHLSITLVDLPGVASFAEGFIRDNGLSERIRFVAGDALADLSAVVEPADAVLLSGVLSDFGPKEQEAILKNAKGLLQPKGALLVSETFLNEEQTGPFLPAFLSLYVLLATPGENFTASRLRRLVEDAGFTGIQIFPNQDQGGRDLLLARRGE